MNTTCKHCDTLDLLNLLDGCPADISDKLREKTIRYYCKNPAKGNDYCPFSGIKEACEGNQNGS